MVLHQVYRNSSDHPLEVLFAMPHSESLCLTKIEVEFHLQNGEKRMLETRVEEREKATQKYTDAVSQGKTAVLSTYSPSTTKTKSLLRIMLGGFPEFS